MEGRETRYETMPLVLLVDENTASASEVLAGALQDNDRALIVGGRTFGKGLVQSVLNLPDGAGMTLTATRYYTPTGRSIQRDYAATGLYDYYSHRTAEIDKPLYAARTVTKRVVYGGDGIMPDEAVAEGVLTAERIALLDPIFFFARELTGGRQSDAAVGEFETLQRLRQRIVFGEPPVDDEILGKFDQFVSGNAAWTRLRSSVIRERAFVTRMLAQYLSMATFGVESAERVRIESDPVVDQAVRALPRSAQLSAAAQRARSRRK